MDYNRQSDESYASNGAAPKKVGKTNNVLPLWGNEATMNLNPLILTNIQGSSYFKVHLFKLKTYHEVVDEIYYQVKHLEPWERGSRKTSGQTGMCGGVRGVGAGGIVSTAFCLLYKLYTLRLTRKQLNGLLTHTDSPYIRSLGFMYIRYTQPPGHLYDWYEEYLQDEEEVDVKAGGGQTMQIGQMLHQWLVKLDWYSTLFPRIPVPIQKQIEQKLTDYARDYNINFQTRYIPMERENIGGASGGGGGNGGGGASIGGGGGGGRYGNPTGANRDYDRRDAYTRPRDRNERDKDKFVKYERNHDDRRVRSRSRSRERNDGGGGEYRDSRYRNATTDDYHKRNSSSGGGGGDYKDRREKDYSRDNDRKSSYDKYNSGSTYQRSGSSSRNNKYRDHDYDREQKKNY